MVPTSNDVPPVVKYSVMVVSKLASCTTDGSAAPSTAAASRADGGVAVVLQIREELEERRVHTGRVQWGSTQN